MPMPPGVKIQFDDCRTNVFLASCLAVKTYSHPALIRVSLHAVMQALSDPCRVAIVRDLLHAKGRALACNEVRLKISKATRSHHFEVLRAAGIIFTEMDGSRCKTSLRRRELNQRFPGLLKLVAAGK
jgi:DNA-binding transcriptional ArsR family regulator